MLPNSRREMSSHVKSHLEVGRGLACPEKSLPLHFFCWVNYPELPK